jgi:hypothetical protein
MILVPQGGGVRYFYTAPGQVTGITDLVLRILDDDGFDISGSPFAVEAHPLSPGTYRSANLIVLDTLGTYRTEWTSAILGAKLVEDVACVPPGSQAWQDAVFHSGVFGGLLASVTLVADVGRRSDVRATLAPVVALVGSVGEGRR